jgi:hypothetical protein
MKREGGKASGRHNNIRYLQHGRELNTKPALPQLYVWLSHDDLLTHSLIALYPI